MEIDGVVQRTIERCVEVQGGKTETFEVSGRHKVRNIVNDTLLGKLWSWIGYGEQDFRIQFYFAFCEVSGMLQYMAIGH